MGEAAAPVGLTALAWRDPRLFLRTGQARGLQGGKGIYLGPPRGRRDGNWGAPALEAFSEGKFFAPPHGGSVAGSVSGSVRGGSQSNPGTPVANRR